jgi:hypothetical protein
MAPRGSGAAAPAGALRAIDASARPRLICVGTPGQLPVRAADGVALLLVVAMGHGPSRGQVGAPAAQRGRTSLTPARAVAASFTEKQGWLAHRAHLLRCWERDNGGVCMPAPSLIWVLEPATGRVRRQDAGWGTGCARPRSLWRPPAAGPWRQARCGRRPRHICCAVGGHACLIVPVRPPPAGAGRGLGRGRRRRARSGCGAPGGRACGPPSGRPGCRRSGP